jgi:P-type Cu+ transporter
MTASPVTAGMATNLRGNERNPLQGNNHDHGSGHDSEHDEHAHGVEWADLLRIAFVALAAAAVWFRLWEPFPRLSVIGIAATLIGGYPIFKEAVENIVARKMTMELSMTIALLSALAIGEFFTALVITGFVLAAEVLEGLTVGRGRRAIQDLLDYLPRTVTVRRNEQVIEIAADRVQVGETVIVKPGGHIPVDGTVAGGRSFVEQAAITGEAMPVEKASGDTVYAGTINQSGALEVRAEKLGRDTTFGRIIEAVERAEKSRAPIQKTADRLAGYLVYFALGAAVLTFIITHNVRSTISVVIVAGACGIAAGTPLAILGAIGRAAHQGAIIKGGLYLEALAAVDTVLLDKTGTLTFGTPQIQEVVSSNGFAVVQILAAASIAESKSEHPVAKAILRHTAELRVPVVEPDEFSYTPGRGVRVTYGKDEILVGSRMLLVEHGVAGVAASHKPSATGGSEVYVALRSVARQHPHRGCAASRGETGCGVVAADGSENDPTQWRHPGCDRLGGPRPRSGRGRRRPSARTESEAGEGVAQPGAQGGDGGRRDQRRSGAGGGQRGDRNGIGDRCCAGECGCDPDWQRSLEVC